MDDAVAGYLEEAVEDERRVRLFIMQHAPRAPTKPKLSEAG
jgi:hypothetical protein